MEKMERTVGISVGLSGYYLDILHIPVGLTPHSGPLTPPRVRPAIPAV